MCRVPWILLAWIVCWCAAEGEGEGLVDGRKARGDCEHVKMDGLYLGDGRRLRARRTSSRRRPVIHVAFQVCCCLSQIASPDIVCTFGLATLDSRFHI